MFIMSEIILNYVRLSIFKYSLEINIKCYDILIDGINELVCELSNDSNTIYEELLSDNTTDCYVFEIFKNKNKWEKVKCLFLLLLEDSKQYIRLIIKKDNNNDIETSLSNEQLSIISSIKKKIILIVDDSITAIKMLFQKIVNLFIKSTHKSSIVINEDWSNVKLTNVELGDYYLLFCCNGQI